MHGTNEGRSLLGLLVTLAILGITAGIVVASTGGETSLPTLPQQSGTTVTGSTVPGHTNTESPVSAAVAETCRSDYEAVAEAVTAYSAVNGHNPTSIAQLSGWLKDPVTSPYFVISLDTTGSGNVDVSAPGHPSSTGDSNCAFAGPSRT